MSESSHGTGGHRCPLGNPRCGLRKLTAGGSPRWFCARCREALELAHAEPPRRRFLPRVAIAAIAIAIGAGGIADRQADVRAAGKGCGGVSAGLIDFHAALKRGFDHDRWVDPTPLRRGDRRQLARIYRCAAPDAKPAMSKMRRKAKRRFHRHFLNLISPPGRGYLDRLASCETRGYSRRASYRAVSPNGLYRGRYQFDRQTWGTVGGRGDPAAAPPREQDFRAAELYRDRGTQPWPRCG